MDITNMKIKYYFSGTAVCTCLGLLVTACNINNNKINAEEKISIGGIFALTGSAADWGQAEQRGVQLAIDKANQEGGINSRQIELASEDAQAEKVDDNVTAFRKLANVKKVPVIIGPTWDDAAVAIAPLADSTKTLVIGADISSGVEAKKDYPFFFSIYTPEAIEMQALNNYLVKNNLKKVSVVFNQDPFSGQWRESFVRAATTKGVTIISEYPISDANSKDFRTQIAKLKTQKPNAIYIEFADQATKGTFMRQAKELGLQSKIVSSSTSETQSNLDQYGTYIEGLTYTFPRASAAQQAFNTAFKAKYNELPKAPSAANAYDATNLVIAAMKEGATTGEAIRVKLLAKKDYVGASSSSISFSPTGRVQWPASSFTIKKVASKKFVETAN
jgi:branched-chain amino acid transport system substrate-binding protein